MTQLRMNFFSRALGRPTDLAVLLPPAGSIPNGGCPVLYLLHGYSDGYATFLSNSGLEQFCSGTPLCVVMPDGAKSFYTDMAYGDNYWSYISDELPQLVNTYFPISKKREETFAGGISMGGYGALKLALKKPDKFSAALAISPVVDIKRLAGGGKIPKVSDIPDIPEKILYSVFGGRDLSGSGDDLFRLAENANKKTRLLFYSGSEDLLYSDIKRFHAHCSDNGFTSSLVTAGGTHCWSTWNPFIRDGIGQLAALAEESIEREKHSALQRGDRA